MNTKYFKKLKRVAKKKSKALAVFVFALSLVMPMVPAPAEAQSGSATLFIAPGSGTYTAGQNFTVSVVASSSDRMNAAEATLSFNTSLLSVVSTSKDGSAFSLWTEEPSHSNSQGTIRFGGGNPSGFTGNATLLKITFTTKGEGSARVSFTDGAVLAADGKGTNILSSMSPANYTIAAQQAPPPPPPPSNNTNNNNTNTNTQPTGSTPPAPEVRSSTHPDQESWYNSTTGEFEWDVPSGVTSVRLLLNEESNDSPTVRHAPPISSRTIEDIGDGVWYLHVQFANSTGLGDIAHYKIQIDTVAPGEFSIELESEEGKAQPELRLESSDELSGISHYEIRVNNEEPIIANAEDIRGGTYKMEPMERGTYTVGVTAVDNAGNKKEAENILEFEVTEDIVDQKASLVTEEGPSFWERFGTAIWVFIFLMIISGLIAMNILQKKKFEQMRLAVIRESKEVRSTTEKVLSALRDEAEDLFAKMDGKAGLNDKEGASFQELQEAIDISEELIGKQIDDIETLFK